MNNLTYIERQRNDGIVVVDVVNEFSLDDLIIYINLILKRNDFANKYYYAKMRIYDTINMVDIYLYQIVPYNGYSGLYNVGKISVSLPKDDFENALMWKFTFDGNKDLYPEIKHKYFNIVKNIYYLLTDQTYYAELRRGPLAIAYNIWGMHGKNTAHLRRNENNNNTGAGAGGAGAGGKGGRRRKQRKTRRRHFAV